MQLGQDMVLMSIWDDGRAVPIQFNSRHRPANPCRGEVVKIGRQYLYLQGIEKTPWKCVPWTEGLRDAWRVAVPIDVAKRLYRESLIENRAWRTDEFIDQCVQEL